MCCEKLFAQKSSIPAIMASFAAPASVLWHCNPNIAHTVKTHFILGPLTQRKSYIPPRYKEERSERSAGKIGPMVNA